MRTRTAESMRDSYLLQRLEKPYRGTDILGPDNPFAFGGGYKNGGLSDDAMSILRGIFRFDYMGSAEFEFGAVPEALSRLADNSKSLTAFDFAIPLSNVEKHWRETSDDEPEGHAVIYVLCQAPHAVEVSARIRQWAKGRGRLKESSHLPAVLRPWGDYVPETCGWLELDNGFFFFTDREMWEQTCRLFGVDTGRRSARTGSSR